MKLIGSRQEKELREELIDSNKALFNNHKGTRLLDVIRTAFPIMKTAYILHCILEQGEDIFTVLINSDIIAVIEIDRYKSEVAPIIETLTIPKYLHGLSKYNQIQLAVALDLVNKDLENLK